ncbi:ATP-dependent RecD-like DNA helicase [Vagococcus fluvialis]|uniref:ATP-dependent RecD-like DNA helicase n=1 Tax=Vagococcus fluvialis TaxID=2738 RepID=UPI0037A68C64
MERIDKAIIEIDKNIFRNIERDSDDRGHLSQNLLAQLRNFVEHVSMKYYFNSISSDLTEVPEELYLDIINGNDFIKRSTKYYDIKIFHSMLQKSVSHYTMSTENSERLMLKYYEYLLKIKKNLKKDFDMDVLMNINKFPVSLDSQFEDYYKRIAEKINENNPGTASEGRYYIQKTKPFFINNEIYYEVTFSEANDKISKFDRNIAFTKQDILSNYAVKLSINKGSVNVYGKNIPILLISDWEVSIRPCELKNFSYILNENINVQSSHNEYKRLMKFIKESRFTILDILVLEDNEYLKVRDWITKKSKKIYFFNTLDKCRDMIINNKPGSNVIRYLLYRLNNKIIKLQTDYYGNICPRLSNLRLPYKCVPFDDMPFVTSLPQHNPKIYDLLWCIDTDGIEHELLARKIKNNAEINGQLYTTKKELENFDNIDELISKYNSKLYYTQKEYRKIANIGSNYFINGYEDEVITIIEKLKDLSSKGYENYENSVINWLDNSLYEIDCNDKKKILKKMFSDSKVALIYGAAGTGKSTMINHIGNFFKDEKKILLANTNPAVDNLKRKVNSPNSEFKTIAKFTRCQENQICDILIVDECSTVSNKDMINILNKAEFKLLVLVGDIYQIESITFGNWFKIAKNTIAKKTIYELKEPYRTKDSSLLNLWKRVRENKDDLIEYLAVNDYSETLNENIFSTGQPDEIILCLNYDGLYGINNINRILQSNNPNKSVDWGVLTYKINDPVLFSDSSRFSPVLFNNLKGTIRDITNIGTEIIFDVEIDISINEMQIENLDMSIVRASKNSTVVRFSVYKFNNMTDDDNDSDETVVPFQIAYAVSIHKAQGLEFNSVNVIITSEIDELITHNILYTAITRTTKKLKIFWTPETEKKVIENIKINHNGRDESILKRKLR